MVNPRLTLVLLTLALLGAFALDLIVGSYSIPLEELGRMLLGTSDDALAHTIIYDIRLPRAIVALLVGVALSVSGMQMQTLFRNPLADPYLLGVSSGAGLGVALLVLATPMLGLGFIRELGTVGAAWLGTALVLALIGIMSRRLGSIYGVLVVGVMLSYAASAIIQILMYQSSAEQLKLYSLWTMGSFSGVTTERLVVMIPIIVLGLVLSIRSIKALNLMLLGAEYASTMGLDVRRSRQMLFVSTALLTGTVTAYCGPVGFVGLCVPHLSRLLFGTADHRTLLPANVLIGGTITLVCDMLAGLYQLPINALTTLLGAPIVLGLIMGNLRRQAS